MTASYQCSLGVQEDLNPQAGSSPTTLLGSIGEALETITFEVFLRAYSENF